MTQPLRGKVAAITGAGSGFGREFARMGAQLGMRLALSDVQPDALTVTVAELKDAGADLSSDIVDVADTAQVKQWSDRVHQHFGNVHLLMNNAGVGGGGYLWESTDQDWQWVMGVNLMGVVHGVQHFVPRMLEANTRGEWGHIVNTASMAGWLAPPLMGVYNVSKHAVVALSETLYHDLQMAGSTIGVSVFCVPRSCRPESPSRIGIAQPTCSTATRADGFAEKGASRHRESRVERKDDGGTGRPADVRCDTCQSLLRFHAPANTAVAASAV